MSEALPHRNELTPDSDRGHVVHQYLANVPRMGKDAALDLVPDEYRQLCELIDLQWLPASKPEQFAAEVSFVYNVKTRRVRELGQGVNRDYELLDEYDIPCTLDNVGIAIDGVTAIVTDYKGGWSLADPAEVNDQLRFGALCFCRARGLKKAHVSIIRVKEDGSSWRDSAEFSTWDLEVIEGEIQRTHEAVMQAKADYAQGIAPTPTMGDHCRYCPAYANCPAVTNLAIAVGQGELGQEVTLTEDNAAEAWRRIKAAKRIIAEVEKSVRGFAEINPIDIGGGKNLAMVAQDKESVCGAVAYGVIRKAFGEDVANKACELSASKASIDKALKPVAKERGIPFAKLKREFLKVLREKRAMVTNTISSVVERKRIERCG